MKIHLQAIQVIYCLTIIFSAGCGTRPEPPLKNAVLVSIDTLRADFLGCYGDPETRSPVLDRLSQNGTLFADHQTNGCWTLPSHATIFTSKYPSSHGLVYPDRVLADSEVTIAELFRAAGFRTGGFVYGGYVSKTFGFDQGFDIYSEFDWCSEMDTTPVSGWLNLKPDSPFFLFLHTFEPHVPYGGYREYAAMYPDRGLPDIDIFHALAETVRNGNAIPDSIDYEHATMLAMLGLVKGPDRQKKRVKDDQAQLARDISAVAQSIESLQKSLEPWFRQPHFPMDRRALIANYRLRINHTDRMMEKILEMISESGHHQDTVLYITSDHGEAFFEHDNTFEHSGNGRSVDDSRNNIDNNYHPEITSVPLLMCRPGSTRPGHLESRLTRSVDILPCMAQMFQLPVQENCAGSSLLPRPGQNNVSVSENQKTHRYAVTRGLFKLVIGGGVIRLFHRDQDPGETVNVADKYPGQVAALQLEFAKWQAEQSLPDSRSLRSGEDLSEELKQQLLELGYTVE